MRDPKRILVVEDSASDRKLMTRAMRRAFAQAEILEVVDLEGFQQHLQSSDFDVAVLDWHLGWSDGTTLMRAIKARRPDCPVVMYTGAAQQEDAVEAMRAGLDDLLMKSPDSFERLPEMICSVLEMAENKKLEKEAEQQEVIGRMANVLTDQIYHPLTALNNVLFLLSRNTMGSDQQLLSVASGQIHLIQETLRGTLAVCGELAQQANISLAALTMEVLESYRRRLEYAGLEVREHYDSNANVKIYPSEVRQLISNLLSNAIEALPRGGKIAVHVCSSRDWRNTSRSGLRLTIVDNGPGMSSDVKAKAFDPFFTTKGNRGSGLGLWVSQGIVRRHKGVISVHSSSRPGRSGTCFSVFFPFEVPEVAKVA
jgi:two-component system NtrC family sensor kinase